MHAMVANPYVQDDNYDPSWYDPPGIMNLVLQAVIELPPFSIVAFHGQPGSGKSCSARWLGRKLGCEPIHLDNFQKLHPSGYPQGFDEDAMRQAIKNAREATLRIVDGVCACRICEPALLVTFGDWSTRHLTRSLKGFIGDYDPEKHRGIIKTFKVRPLHKFF